MEGELEIIRIEKDRVWTPIIEYTTSGTNITAIGMLHIAKPSFYAQVQERIDQHTKGLYEHPKIGPIEFRGTSRATLLERIRDCDYAPFRKLATILEFEFELDVITHPTWWTPVDHSYSKLFENESYFSLLGYLLYKQDIFKVLDEEIVSPEEAMDYIWNTVNPENITGRMLRAIKLEERDWLLCSHIDRLLKSGTTKFGITFGVIHLFAIDAHLQKKGFTREYKGWLCAMERES